MDWYVLFVDDWNMLDDWIRLWYAFHQCNRIHCINVTAQKVFAVAIAVQTMHVTKTMVSVRIH